MKTITQKFALLTSSVLISLLFCEIFVRLFLPQQLVVLRPDIWRPDRVFGHRHQENIATVINRGLGTVQIMTDNNGHRVNRRVSENAIDQTISVLTIGDSFIEGLAVENEYTIPGLIQGHLEGKYKKTIHVDNTGVSGWNPNHYLLEVKSMLSKRKYTLGIVFLYVGNDVIREKVGSFRSEIPKGVTQEYNQNLQLPRSLKVYEILHTILYPISNFFEARSHLFILGKQVGRIQLSRLGLAPGRGYAIFDPKQASSPMWGITGEVCEEIQHEFSKNKTPVFFVVLPVVIQVYGNILKEYIWGFGLDQQSVDHNQPNRILKEEFESRGLHLIDPLEYMREKAQGGFQLYGSVDRHFNKNGHQVITEYIMPIIESYTKLAN